MLGLFNSKKKKQQVVKVVSAKDFPSGFARAYAAADKGRLYESWNSNSNSVDVEVFDALQLLRDRARDLSRNNDYIRRFLNMCQTNIIGHGGIRLQVRSKDASGQLDSMANQIIEDGWKTFSKKGNATVCGTLSMIDLDKIVVNSVFRDGEILLRKIKMWGGNDHMFSLQPIESDHLDHTLNATLNNGNMVVMGVEKDEWKRPVAYWFLDEHPGDNQ